MLHHRQSSSLTCHRMWTRDYSLRTMWQAQSRSRLRWTLWIRKSTKPSNLSVSSKLRAAWKAWGSNHLLVWPIAEIHRPTHWSNMQRTWSIIRQVAWEWLAQLGTKTRIQRPCCTVKAIRLWATNRLPERSTRRSFSSTMATMTSIMIITTAISPLICSIQRQLILPATNHHASAPSKTVTLCPAI